MISYWERMAWYQPADLLIVGGGIVGLTAAICAREAYPTRRVVLVDEGVFPTGASTKNAGFACFGSTSELLADLKSRSEADVFALVEKRWLGLKKLLKRVGEQAMEYKTVGGSEVFTSNDNLEECLSSLPYFNQYLKDITGTPETYQYRPERMQQLGFNNLLGLIDNVDEGQLHPGKLVSRLIQLAREREVVLYTGITINDFHPTGDGSWEVDIPAVGRLRAGRVLVTTNGFVSSLLPELADEVKPARNQVLLTEEIPELPWEGCFHLEEGYFYFRNVGKRILVGGGRHLDVEGETTSQNGFSPIIQSALEELLFSRIFPHRPVSIEYRWSGTLGVGNQKDPIVRWVHPGLLVAVRLGGMGVALGSLVGEEAALNAMDGY